MARVDPLNVLVSRLKKQVILLYRKEHDTTQKLRKAIYKMQSAVLSGQVSPYIKAAKEVEKQLKQKLLAKQKEIHSTISRLEKGFNSALSQAMKEQKATRNGNGRVKKAKKKR